jgi:uncharacterized protein (UPF0332 family)
MIDHRLQCARVYLKDAFELYEKGSINSSASRAYYASYQAMWAVLGDPERQKIWKHLGIIKHFVRGYWSEPQHPKTGPGLLEDLRLPLRRLYSYRIKSDYDSEDVDRHNLLPLLKNVERMLSIIEEKGGNEECR